MDLVDIGANLTHASFVHDFDDVLARARGVGVSRLVVTGTSAAESAAALELAGRHPGVLYATAGVHPHHAGQFTADTESELAALLGDARVRAVGETGLDYYRDLAPRAAQLFAFERQVGLALDTGKPLFLHQREAHDDLVAVLRPVRDRIARAVAHCFTGDRRELYDYLDLDFHIGITGWICDERRGAHLRELVREIPANRLLLETDCPYLLPRTLEPKPAHRRNEPMYLEHICEEVARDRGEPAERTAADTTAAAERFFDLA